MGVRTVPLRLDDDEYDQLVKSKEILEKRSGQELSWNDWAILVAKDLIASGGKRA